MKKIFFFCLFLLLPLFVHAGSIKELEVENGVLSRKFEPNNNIYSILLNEGEEEVKLNYKLEDENAKVKINNKEDFLILVTESENVKCHDIINLLESYNLEFNILNRTEDANYYKTIDKINIEESDITPPTLIYMKEGEFYSFLVSERENDIKSYLEANNIIEND